MVSRRLAIRANCSCQQEFSTNGTLTLLVGDFGGHPFTSKLAFFVMESRAGVALKVRESEKNIAPRINVCLLKMPLSFSQ